MKKLISLLLISSVLFAYNVRSEASELVVHSYPEDALVFIDGMCKGRTPLRLFNFQPGNHSIKLQKTGYADYLNFFETVSGTDKGISVNLYPLETQTPTPESGKLVVRTDPIGAEIYIKKESSLWVDGQMRISSEEINLPPGRYDIRVVKQGYSIWGGNAIIRAGERSEIFASLMEDSTRPDSSPSREGGRSSQSNRLNNALDALTDFFQDANLSMQGYDLQCVWGIREMVKEGKISPGQGQYLMSQTCKKKADAGLDLSSSMSSLTCPICGQIGQSRMGLNGIYYVCPRGHAWR